MGLIAYAGASKRPEPPRTEGAPRAGATTTEGAPREGATPTEGAPREGAIPAEGLDLLLMMGAGSFLFG